MKKKLYLRGWSKKEIDHAEGIIKNAERKKNSHILLIDNSLYWFTLIIGIIGTFIVSLVLIPILIVANNHWSYLLTGFFGLVIGLLITFTIKDFHWLESYHHILISLLIPIIALFNLFIVVMKVNSLNSFLGTAEHHNPIIIGIIYFVCFLIPYGLFLLFRRNI